MITNPSDGLEPTEGGGEDDTRATLIPTLSHCCIRATSHLPRILTVRFKYLLMFRLDPTVEKMRKTCLCAIATHPFSY